MPPLTIWQYGFAITPKNIGGRWIWLERYAYRLMVQTQADPDVEGLSGMRLWEWSSPRIGTFSRWEFLLSSGPFRAYGAWVREFGLIDGGKTKITGLPHANR